MQTTCSNNLEWCHTIPVSKQNHWSLILYNRCWLANIICTSASPESFFFISWGKKSSYNIARRQQNWLVCFSGGGNTLPFQNQTKSTVWYLAGQKPTGLILSHFQGSHCLVWLDIGNSFSPVLGIGFQWLFLWWWCFLLSKSFLPT